MKHPRPIVGVLAALLAANFASADANLNVEKLPTGGLRILRPTLDQPLLVFHAPEDGRPYLHPLSAPDGKGVLTEFSPGHHKHQTGVYVGFLKVNGRDYFHNRGGDHFHRRDFSFKSDSQGVAWSATYDLLDARKQPQLVETQHWHFRDFGQTFLIDFTWKGTAQVDLTFDKHEYGGLFVRMPFKGAPGSNAVNSEGLVNGKAEGKKAAWVDIAMPIEERKDLGHLAVLSHKSNPGAPLPWRVDGQLGVGPAPSRDAAWKLARGESATFRYRFVVYTGATDTTQVQKEWDAFSQK